MNDRYMLAKEPFNSGGMGVIFSAFDNEEERTVCIKVIKKKHANSLDYRRKFLREAKLMEKLEHRNIVRFLDYGCNGEVWIAMELIKGYPLTDSEIPFTIERVLDFLTQISSAVAAAHKINIAHCDIKPGNIIEENGRFVLVDFGLGFRALGDDVSLQRTATRLTGGTPVYASPEQTVGVPDFASDVYSLGCTAFELITGEWPFKGTLVQLANSHAHDVRPSASILNPDCPIYLSALISQMMSIDPADRPSLETIHDRISMREKQEMKAKTKLNLDPDFVDRSSANLINELLNHFLVSRVGDVAISSSVDFLKLANARKKILVVDIDDPTDFITKSSRIAARNGFIVLVGPLSVSELIEGIKG